MKKFLTLGLGLFVLLAIVLYFIGGSLLSKAAETGMETFVPKVTQTGLDIESLHLSPLTGSGTAKGFVLGNPEGFSSDFSIAFGSAHIDVDPMSVMGERILIEQIHIYQPKFNYERKLTTSNIKEILKNVQAASGHSEEGEEVPETAPEEVPESGIRIEIKELIIDEAQVSFSMAGANTVPLPMPKIVLRDIGTKEGGIAPDEMAFEVMSVVLGQVLGAVAKAPVEVVGGVGGVLKGGLDVVTGNKDKEKAAEAAEADKPKD
jgi:hypothetical protein